MHSRRGLLAQRDGLGSRSPKRPRTPPRVACSPPALPAPNPRSRPARAPAEGAQLLPARQRPTVYPAGFPQPRPSARRLCSLPIRSVRENFCPKGEWKRGRRTRRSEVPEDAPRSEPLGRRFAGLWSIRPGVGCDFTFSFTMKAICLRSLLGSGSLVIGLWCGMTQC